MGLLNLGVWIQLPTQKLLSFVVSDPGTLFQIQDHSPHSMFLLLFLYELRFRTGYTDFWLCQA